MGPRVNEIDEAIRLIITWRLPELEDQVQQINPKVRVGDEQIRQLASEIIEVRDQLSISDLNVWRELDRIRREGPVTDARANWVRGLYERCRIFEKVWIKKDRG